MSHIFLLPLLSLSDQMVQKTRVGFQKERQQFNWPLLLCRGKNRGEAVEKLFKENGMGWMS